MNGAWRELAGSLGATLRSVALLGGVIAGFQWLAAGQAPADVAGLIVPVLLAVVGLTLFVRGLETGLFPLGEGIGHALARKGSLAWLLVFAFGVGFGATIAEPALIGVAVEAARVAAETGAIASDEKGSYALGLRISAALGMGLAVMLGVWRIVKGVPLPYLLFAGYGCIVLLTLIAPPDHLGLAYDSGTVTLSTVIIPLVIALGVGLSSSLRERNPVVDGFGMVGLASLAPVLAIMVFTRLW